MNAGDAPAAEEALVRGLARLVLTFAAVTVIDLIVFSLLSGRLRLWFPQWVDPGWAEHPEGWVTYSQSYLSGVAMIPVLLWLVDRRLSVGGGRGGVRVGVWLVGLGSLAGILVWKGQLMLWFGKGREAVGWVALTGLVWVCLWCGEALPRRLSGVSAARLGRGLALGVGVFVLAIGVADVVLQRLVHGTAWSAGLLIEVAMLVPSGVAAIVGAVVWRVQE